MKFFNSYHRGLLLALLGVLFITPDSLLILMADQPVSNLMFWRNGFTALVFLPLLILWQGRIFDRHNFGKLQQQYKKNDVVTRTIALPHYIWGAMRKLYPAMMFYTLTSVCFIIGTKENTVASNLVILATAPLIGALLTSFYLKKKVPKENWLASIGVLLGILLVMGDGLANARLLGSMASLGAAFCFACYYVSLQDKQVSAILVVFLATLTCAVVATPLVDWQVVTGTAILIMFINMIFTNVLGFCLTTYATRFIATEEVLLLFMLETLIGPLWVWYFLSQAPSPQIVIGGAIVLIVVAVWITRRLTLARRGRKKLATT